TVYGGDTGQVAKVKLFAPGTTGSALWGSTGDSRSLSGKAFLGVVYGLFRDDEGMGFGLANVLTDGTVELYTDETSLYRAQIVHNAADPALGRVDLYMDGGLLVRDFEFQTATKYLDLPAGIHTFEIAPAESSSPTDPLWTKRISIREGETYSVVAAGVLEPENWNGNPDGKSTALDLFVADGAVEATGSPNEFTLRQFYGITDLPSCHFGNGPSLLFRNASYGDFTDYTSGETGSYVGRLQSAGTTTAPLVELQGDFTDVGGLGILDMPSGFFAKDGALAIEWIQVLPDGTVVRPGQTTKTVDVQIIHGSADPAVETVDIYLDGGLLIDDLGFKSAKPFVKLPLGTHEFSIAEASSVSKEGAIRTRRQSFADGRNYTMVLAGVVDPESGQWMANPDGRDISLNLFVDDDALKESPTANEWAIRQFYGITDLEAVDFWIDDIDYLAYQDNGFGDFTEIELDAHRGTYTGVMRPAGSPQSEQAIVCTSVKDWGPYAGLAILSVWTGTIADGIDWFYVTPIGEAVAEEVTCNYTGTATEEETEIPSTFAIEGNYPNPFNPSTSIIFDLPESAAVSVEVYDATGRMVFKTDETRFGVGAGQAVHVDATAWSSGLYLYKVIARGRTSSWTGSGRMILVK
ncbi:MAG: DUF4397 domain-containing protein, partial [Candidatus Latescibacterota bacterium]